MSASFVDMHTTAVTFQDQLDAAQTVTGVISLSAPSISAEQKDRTTLEDSTWTRTAMGLLSGGEATLELYYNPSDTGQAAIRAALLARNAKELSLTFSDGSTVVADCFVVGFDGPSGATQEDATITYTLLAENTVVETP